MSTTALIRFCNENEEAGAIVLWADGYPSTVRDQLLKKLADDFFCGGNANDAMDDFPVVLAFFYGYDITNDDEAVANAAEGRLFKSFNQYPTYKTARDMTCGTDYEYTVHIVNGKVYY